MRKRLRDKYLIVALAAFSDFREGRRRQYVRQQIITTDALPLPNKGNFSLETISKSTMTIYDLNGFDTIDFKVYAVQSDSEQSLLKKLKLLYKSTNPKHCDVSFKCSDGKSIYGHKVIMAIRSDYFDTLFRYEPNKTQFEVPQFDSKLMNVIIKSMVEINLEDIEGESYIFFF